MYHNFKMVATTMFGLEEVLATELTNLGAQDVEVGVRSVSFVGDKGFMYKANIALRTAIRILKPIKRFRVSDEDDLYKKIQQIEWERFMTVDSTFAIGAVVNSKNFTTNSHYISLKSKDAIADYFRHKYHKRPNVDVKHPDLKEGIYLEAQLDAKDEPNAIEIDRNLLSDTNTIFVLKDNVLEAIPAKPVYFTDTKVVLKDVADGTIIIAKPVPGAYSGMLVKPYTNSKAE